MRLSSWLLGLSVSLAACQSADDLATVGTSLGGPNPPMAFSGDYEGTVIVVAADRDAVAALLPPQLELAPQNLTDAAHHAVALLLLDETSYTLGLPLLASTFKESSMVVLATRPRAGVSCDGRSRFGYLPVMYVDNAIAVLSGAVLFGLNGHLATITSTPASWTASSQDAAAPMTLVAQFAGDASLTPAGSARFQLLAQELSAPTASRGLDGLLRWQIIDWRFGEAAVASRAVDLTSSWPTPSLPDITAAVGGLNAGLGGMGINGTFASSLPAICTGP